MAQPISLDTSQQSAPEPISLDTGGQSSVVLPPEVAAARARKAEFGLGPVTGIDKDTAHQAINSGQEQTLRRASAAEIDRQRSDQKAALVQQMARAQDGSISMDQLKYINDKYSLSGFLGQAAPTDPNAVLEDYYAGQYLKPMYDVSDQFNQGSFMPEAMRQMPDQVRDIKAKAESISANREIIKTRLENARAKLSDQPTLSRGIDFAKELVPGYSEEVLKGGWSNIFSGGLRGTAMHKKALELWALPPDKLRTKFNSEMDALEEKDPALAVEYGEHMLGFSTSEEHLQNAFSLLDVAAIPAVGIGRAVLRGVKGVAEVTGVTQKLVDMAETRNTVATAAKDAVQSQEAPGITLGELRNQDFGRNSAEAQYKIDQAKKEYKRIANAEVGPGTGFANEGLRSQALTRVFNQSVAAEKELERLKNLHSHYSFEDPENSLVVQQTVDKDPAIASAVGRGDLKTAGIEKAAVETAEELKGTGDPVKNTIEALTDSLRVDDAKAISDPGHGGQEFVNRLRETGDVFIQKLQNAAKNIMRVQRIPGILANKEALKAIAEYTKDLYPGIRNAILNVTDPVLNETRTGYNQSMIFGRMTGEYFASKEEATGFAELNGFTAEVKQKGLGWYLEVQKPLDETMHPIRDWLIKTKESETPGGWLNATVGWLRTPEDTLSLEQNMQRKLATYNIAPFMSFAKESIQDIRSLGGVKNVKNWYAQWRDWERAVDYARSAPVPGSLTGETGYFFKTGQELDDFWMRNFDNQLPSIAQKSAYFQFKRIVEYDRILRAMSMYRNKVRLGVESHAISMFDAEGNKIQSSFFDGAVRKDIPGGVGNVLIADRETGKNIYAANAIPPKLRNELIDKITKGELKVVEVYSPKTKPLQGFNGTGDDRVRYAIARNTETKPISITDQVPRKGGGHFEYDYSHYIKQADVELDSHSGHHIYNGDTTVMPVSIRAVGLNVVPKLNAIRELIAADKIEEAKALATSKDGVPAIPWDTQLGWYNKTKNAEGNWVKPRLNKNEEIKVVPSGKTIGSMDNSLKDKYKNTFLDGSREGSMEKGNEVQFTAERDAHDIYALNDIGTKNNPVYTYEPAKLVDPITTMNRSLSRIVTSTIMDDYKIYSVESWIQEAKNWLDVGNRHPDDMLRSPFYYFNNPEWVKGTPEEVKNILMGNKLKIDRLVGVPSKVDSFLHSAATALSDSVYNKFGPKGYDLTPAWLLPKLKDPTRFLRSIVFNEKMGLFSVPQFMVHAMTYANVMGIAGPKNGTIGAVGALLHGWAAVNKDPAIVEALDKIMTNMGAKPGFFKEAHDLQARTGFMDVAGEHVFMDAPMANKIIQNKGATFLDAGQIFFRGGVKSLRAGSWYTAIKEFRDVHPIGAITDDDLKGILNRADLLSHNMSRASTSTLTTGVMAVPAQFYTYWLRLQEMMIGKRLTYGEKARLLGVNAALFGIPVAGGLVPGLGLFTNNLRTYAQQNNYQVGENFLTTGMMEGGLSLIGQMISGHNYNIGERYGAPKGEPIENILEQDKTFLQIFGGAAFNSLSNTVEQSNGLMHLIMSGIRGDGEALGNATPEDFAGPFKEITSVNGAFKIIAATRYGNWLSKNNAVLHPNSPANAVFESLSGLSEQQDTELWTKSQDLKTTKQYENKLFGMFQNRFSLGMQETNNKNQTQGEAYFREAFAILHQGGYPEDKIPEAVAAALESSRTPLVDRMNFNYYLKKILPTEIGKK